MHLRNSPISQTPPKNLATIPENLIKGKEYVDPPKENGLEIPSSVKKGKIWYISRGADS